jgi:hypothetical protein
MGNIRFKLFQSVTASSLIELVLLIYFHLGYMFQHKCHHQAFINLNLKHKLSYIEYNAVSVEEDDKNSIIDMWDPTMFSLKSQFRNLFSNPP